MPVKPFILSVKIMIRNEEGQYLLLRRSADSKANAGKWEMPGGKIEPCESFEKALIREVLEETGLKISMSGVAGAAESETPDKKVAYLIMEGVTSSKEVVLSAEHDSFAWVEPESLQSMDIVQQFIPFIRRFASNAWKLY